ncbi:MAG: hypothetical protein NTW95_15195 [Candidatus Aminicenantes bacterium]|nr:hypothetical protein [Candidatus Aminicenantes bacterium]
MKKAVWFVCAALTVCLLPLRAWLTFRDRELAWLAVFYGRLDGTMYRNMLAADRVDLIKRRVLELDSYLDVLKQL